MEWDRWSERERIRQRATSWWQYILWLVDRCFVLSSTGSIFFLSIPISYDIPKTPIGLFLLCAHITALCWTKFVDFWLSELWTRLQSTNMWVDCINNEFGVTFRPITIAPLIDINDENWQIATILPNEQRTMRNCPCTIQWIIICSKKCTVILLWFYNRDHSFCTINQWLH